MEDKILNALKNNGAAMKAGEISLAINMDKKDVDKAIKELVKEGKLYSPKRCFYDISK